MVKVREAGAQRSGLERSEGFAAEAGKPLMPGAREKQRLRPRRVASLPAAVNSACEKAQQRRGLLAAFMALYPDAPRFFQEADAAGRELFRRWFCAHLSAAADDIDRGAGGRIVATRDRIPSLGVSGGNGVPRPFQRAVVTDVGHRSASTGTGTRSEDQCASRHPGCRSGQRHL